MKKTIKRVFASVLALSMLLALASCGNSTTGTSGTTSAAGDYDPTQGTPMTIKVGTGLYEGSVGVRALQAFEEYLEDTTGGRIQVEIYPGGVLGNATVMREMLFENDIQIDVINPISYEKDISALSILDNYYMFDDLDHLHRFWEGEGGQYMYDTFNKIGLQGLAVMSQGFRELYNSARPIRTLDDLKGLSIRGYSTIQIAAWEAVGVVPISVDWNELFVSMQQKLVDGEEGGISNFEDYSFYEVQPYFTITDHAFGCDMAVCSQEWLNSLSDGDRELVYNAADVLYQYHKEHYIPENEALLKKFADEYGVEVIELDPEVKAEMAEIMGAATTAIIKESCGEDVFNQVMGYVDAARA